MRRHLNRLSLRIRLALAFAGAAAVLLAAIGAFIFVRVKSGLDEELDHSLRLRASELARRATDPRQLRAGLDAAGQPAQLLTRDGRVIVSTRVKRDRPLIGPVHLAAARRGEVVFGREENTRILGRPAGPRTIVAVAASMRQRERTLESLSGVLLVGLPIALLLASAAGYLVAAGALRPVERMRRRAAGISQATSDARLPLPAAHDEIHRLGVTLNAMLARISAAAQQEREFVSNASHELRTPLAILKAEIDVALHPDAEPSEWHYALLSAGEETDRLAQLAENLLMIARGEEGAPAADLEELGLRAFAERVAGRFDAQVGVTIDPGLRVLAQPVALDRAVTNLVDNALRYGAEPIEITARPRGEWVELHVVDQGAGFADEYLPRAFERFSRPTGARTGGAGLGLALVDAVARTYGGEAGAANAPAAPTSGSRCAAPGRRPGATEDPWSAVAGPVETAVAGTPRTAHDLVMPWLERHSHGPRLHVGGRRIHEWHAGGLVLALAALGLALDLWDLSVEVWVAGAIGLWLVAKDWQDIVPSRRDNRVLEPGIPPAPVRTAPSAPRGSAAGVAGGRHGGRGRGEPGVGADARRAVAPAAAAADRPLRQRPGVPRFGRSCRGGPAHPRRVPRAPPPPGLAGGVRARARPRRAEPPQGTGRRGGAADLGARRLAVVGPRCLLRAPRSADDGERRVADPRHRGSGDRHVRHRGVGVRAPPTRRSAPRCTPPPTSSCSNRRPRASATSSRTCRSPSA